ncbi:anthrone oxygenase family protein [Congregibacter variabilis]|uniref:Anthrone oxygenase family protein n=1 Tax=Congregibacter variabilis TaxID=3081200 RepID=A0ABZ0I1S2_9GAMM|nr:anthrone oxygenase family protein [Congregibacter sp. IMCC43200]
MSYEWPLYLCLFLALWSAVIAGVFSAFSEFIMSALLRAAPAAGIESMQHINRTVLKTQFVAGILLISVFSILFAAYGFFVYEGTALALILLASLAYVSCVFLVTMFGNVPMNKKLEEFDYRSVAAADYWIEYGRVWTRLNHFRSVGGILTAGLYAFAAIILIHSGQV